MKKIPYLTWCLAVLLFMASCTSMKKVTYFKNIEQVNLAVQNGLYDAKIMPKDMLHIIVTTTNREAAQPFNLYNVSGTTTQYMNTSNNSLFAYLVDNEGNIEFPVIGKIHVLGLTKNQCQDLIRSKIAPYMAKSENPVVIVRMASFRVVVMGEVGAPRVIPVETEKMNVLEALTQAGDLTIYGKRDNVLLIRENAAGEREAHRLNLNDANIFNSPYFYLQQNDIIYVQPNKVKANNSSIGPSVTMWMSALGWVTSIATLVISLIK